MIRSAGSRERRPPIYSPRYDVKIVGGRRIVIWRDQDQDRYRKRQIFLCAIWRREDTHKKSVFFSSRTAKVLPSLLKWLSGPCHFFFSLLIAFLLSGQRVYPPYTLSGPTTKKTFLCVSSLREGVRKRTLSSGPIPSVPSALPNWFLVGGIV